MKFPALTLPPWTALRGTELMHAAYNVGAEMCENLAVRAVGAGSTTFRVTDHVIFPQASYHSTGKRLALI